METEITPEGERALKSKMMAFISYLGILCMVPLLLNKTDEYVNFHARQGVVIWIWSVVAIFMHYLPVVGYFIFVVSAFGIVLFSVFGMVSVVFNKEWHIPVIYSISKRM